MTITTVKKGYKMTEIGVIPEDWDVVKIGDFISITTGSRNTQDKKDDGKYPFFVRSQTVERINTYSFDGEAVLTAGDGVGTGKVFHYIRGKFDFHQRVYKMSDFGDRVDGYFFYLFFSNNFLQRITAMTAKSSVDSVRMEMISEMKMPLPSKMEQKAIATVLSDTDELISSLEALIAKKRRIKEGAMQELLTGKKRLAGFSGEWRVEKIRDLATICRGASPRPIDSPIWFNDKSQVGWVRISDVSSSNKYLKRTAQFLSELGIKHSRFVEKGNLIMSICATVGRPILIQFNVCIHDGFVVFGSPKADKEYLYYYLSFIEKDWAKNGQTGSQMNLNTDLINNTEIQLPSTQQEQQAIAQILSDMDSEIAVLEAKRDKYKLVKQGLMQMLLTGKIRLI